MRIFIFIIGSLILAFFANDARSDDRHHRGTKVDVSSQAIAIATSQIHPELGSSKLQLGMGISTHNNDTALAIGLHKRVNKVLIGGTFSSNGNSTAAGFGVNMKFR